LGPNVGAPAPAGNPHAASAESANRLALGAAPRFGRQIDVGAGTLQEVIQLDMRAAQGMAFVEQRRSASADPVREQRDSEPGGVQPVALQQVLGTQRAPRSMLVRPPLTSATHAASGNTTTRPRARAHSRSAPFSAASSSALGICSGASMRGCAPVMSG
jgi:hypothetical protein